MLLVPTILKPSTTHGLGVFAAEPIASGTTVWKLAPGFDVLLTDADFENLPHAARCQVLHYGYKDLNSGTWVVCLDDARFMNHSADPNTRSRSSNDLAHDFDVAARDIDRGEELTCDYATFDADALRKLVGTREVQI